MEKDGCERKAEEKNQCRSTQVKHSQPEPDQSICIDLSLGPSDHTSMREVADGTGRGRSLQHLVTLTYVL